MSQTAELWKEITALKKQVEELQKRLDEKEEAEIFQSIDSLDQERESERLREWFECQQGDWM